MTKLGEMTQKVSQKKRGLLNLFYVIALVGYLFSACTPAESLEGYLFVYFTGNGPGEEQIRYAISEDGYTFRALNDNKPVVASEDISTSGGVRDPHILRCEDGKTFYMVVTDLYVPNMGWQNTAMILMKSTDMVNWESSVIDIPKTYTEEFGEVNRVWAPQTIYDKEAGKYMVYFSMRKNEEIDIIYYAYANKDFTALESAPKQLFFSPTNNACIDADIVEKDNKYYMFFKSENGNPGIKLAISDKVSEGFEMVGPERVDKEKNNVEGSGVFKLNNSDEWILMYDVYLDGKYQFTKSKDLMNFEVIDHAVSMNFHPRHGTVLPITGTEMKRLVSKFGSFSDPLIEATSENIKSLNVTIDAEKKTMRLPVKPGTDVSAFDPQFTAVKGFSVTPVGPQDFSNGTVEYSVAIEGKGAETFKVTVSEDHNPVLPGYKADPDVMYSEKTGKFYIYPTSDGFNGWSGYYFNVFSSDDLVNWTDEGTIIDLKKEGQVVWADRHAWAPCIIEKKINGDYKYFYYFTAAQKIGVAVADNPTGPFTDKGEPLVAAHPKGVNWGQEIDPEVFEDPETGKSYLYWGNGYMAVAELNADMVSIKENTTKIMTPDNTFREGATVFYREGKYYFLWSEDDTRSPNYKVRYAYSDSPTGKLTIPENNLVIMKKPEVGIYGTGHNSILEIPGKDEWYIVYHRFNVPNGIKMGGAAGFHREVCIDAMSFDENGLIIPVEPTLEGIQAVKL